MTIPPSLHPLAAEWLDRAPSIETEDDAWNAATAALEFVSAGLPKKADDPVNWRGVYISAPLETAALSIAQFVTAIRFIAEQLGFVAFKGGGFNLDIEYASDADCDEDRQIIRLFAAVGATDDDTTGASSVNAA